MKKIIYLLSALMFLSLPVTSQNTKKGYKWLEKLEYDKAKSVFDEMYASDPKNPAVNLGLALICSDDKSPYYNLVSGWFHCIAVQEGMDNLLQEDLEYIGEYFMNTEQRPSSRPVKKKIEYAISIVESHLIKHVREENNLALTYEVLEKFPDFRYYGNVIHIRNQLEFRKYEKQNTLEGYLEFIDRFPDAAQLDKAIAYRNKLAFEKARSYNTLNAYEDYMKEYADAPEYTQAVKNRNALAFSKAVATNTMQGYDAFIDRYPDAFEIAEAKVMQKKLLFEYAKTIKTLEAYDDFIKKYPEGQQYIDIFNLKSSYLGNLYKSSSGFTANASWVRCFDLANKKEGRGTLTMMEDGRTLLAVTSRKHDTACTDIWLICLDAEGKMIWNKTTGGDFNDEVWFSSVNQGNEVILAGYTASAPDSSANEVWLFKQTPDGRNLWSQKLGIWEANSLVTDESGRILLGGYRYDDSLRRHYRIITLNDMGRKLWDRTYTDYGEVHSLDIMPDKSILVVAGGWIFRIDTRGYLKWEYVPTPEILYRKGMSFQTGEFCIAGIRNPGILTAIRFSSEGKKKWEKQYAMPDSVVSIVKMAESGSGRIVLAVHYKNTGSAIIWLQALTGEILKEKPVSTDNIMDFMIDKEKNLWILLESGNAVLVKMKGSDF